MTALKQYQRLEATGLWRATPQDQRREVVISIGEATLTISDMKDQALTHWSLAAVERSGEGLPAIYHPNGDPDETLELGADEDAMIDAIERLRAAVSRARPRPGRLRLISGLTTALVFVLLFVFWLPGALQRHAVKVVPPLQRAEIGEAILHRIERVAGQACQTQDATPILARLADRTGAKDLVVLQSGISATAMLPGGIVVLNKTLVEDFEDPAVPAGFVLAEQARAIDTDPLTALLSFSGPIATVKLLTTGQLDTATLDRYAEWLLTTPRPAPDLTHMVDLFALAGIPTRPYAYALDITGERVLDLIEADPFSGTLIEPVMPDRDWLLLQSICGA